MIGTTSADADPRVGAVVPAQVDSSRSQRRSREQRSAQLLLASDKRENGAVVVGVGMHVEQPCVLRTARRRSRRSSRIAPFAEVRYGLERQHTRTLGRCASTTTGAPRNTTTGIWGAASSPAATGPAGRTRSASSPQRIGDLPPGRTLDVACGTGFPDPSSARRRRRARPERPRCSRKPLGSCQNADLRPGRCVGAAVPRSQLRPRVHRALLRPSRRAGTKHVPCRGAARGARAGRGRRLARQLGGRRGDVAARSRGRLTLAGLQALVRRARDSPRSSAAERCLFAGSWFVLVRASL